MQLLTELKIELRKKRK